MEGFAVTCPLAPDVPHLRSGSCSSPRAFGLDFLQTSPHDDALALLLAFGSANTWHGDFHPASSVPCPAHTPQRKGGGEGPAFFSYIYHLLFRSVIHGIGILQGNHMRFPHPLIPGLIYGGFLDHLQTVFHLSFRCHRLTVETKRET